MLGGKPLWDCILSPRIAYIHREGEIDMVKIKLVSKRTVDVKKDGIAFESNNGDIIVIVEL